MNGCHKLAIKTLGTDELGLLTDVAEDVFDHALDVEATNRFLADPRHHIIVALDGSTVVGFVTAVHTEHPDKAHPEMRINEVGVAPPYQRQGVATSMLQALKALASGLGCREAWVLTEKSNLEATALYTSSGGVQNQDAVVMYSFDIELRA